MGKKKPKWIDVPPELDAYVDEFVQSYMGTALWSSNDESDESGGRPLDDRFNIDDIDDRTADAMRRDCERFVVEHRKLLEGWDAEIAGHCFWLNRNGHGTGFWDREDGAPGSGKSLSDASHKAGERNLYVGDDGKIYQYGSE